VFQFESSGMRDVLRRYQPNSIEDLTALNALYRPGPIQGGMIDDFIERKHGRRKIEYDLPELKEILHETLGVFVYQEQVMQTANKLAGYSLGQADLLRRAMGKKNAEEMAKQREGFVQGATKNGFPPKKIEKIFDLMAQFAGIWVQQVALGGLCAAGVSHCVFEDASSARLYGGAADFDHGRHRQRGEVYQRMPRDGDCG
jgi:DNA polymerase III subunit alpha